MTRARTTEIAKQKELKELFSDVVKNTNKNVSTQNTQSTNGALFNVYSSLLFMITKFAHQIFVHKNLMCKITQNVHIILAHRNLQCSINKHVHKTLINKNKTSLGSEKGSAQNRRHKGLRSKEILLIKKRLHKAKRILHHIQKLNVKQWTSLKIQ